MQCFDLKKLSRLVTQAAKRRNAAFQSDEHCPSTKVALTKKPITVGNGFSKKIFGNLHCLADADKLTERRDASSHKKIETIQISIKGRK
jgi:hypothetical protein